MNVHRLRLASGVSAVVAGAVFGAATSVANHVHGPVAAHLSQLLDAAWTWAAIGLVACFCARRWHRSALLGAGTLVAAVVAYDVTDLYYGVYTGLTSMDAHAPVGVDWSNFASDVVTYVVLALATAAGLATVVRLIRGGGLPGLAAQLVVPAYAAWSSYQRVQEAYLTPDAASTVVSVNYVVTGVAVIIILVLVVRYCVHRRPRDGRRGRPTGAVSTGSHR